jgi:hypothetical protein
MLEVLMVEGMLCAWEEEGKEMAEFPEQDTPLSGSGTSCSKDMILLLRKHKGTFL